MYFLTTEIREKEGNKIVEQITKDYPKAAYYSRKYQCVVLEDWYWEYCKKYVIENCKCTDLHLYSNLPKVSKIRS